MTQELEELITAIVPKMEGWATVPKALAMVELILEVRPSVVVELGVFAGRSMIPQAMALRENLIGRIYGVDPWHVQAALEGDIGAENADWWRTAPNLDLMHQLCVNEIWKHGLDHHAVLIRGRAHEVSMLFRDGIDILHFDQNHSEFASVRDIEIYCPLVRPGGYIWFDDADWATTQKALNWLSQRTVSVKDVGTCRLFRKEPVPVLEQQARGLTKVLDEFLAQDIPEIQIQHAGTFQSGAVQADIDPVAEERATGNGHDEHRTPASMESYDAGDEERIPGRAKVAPGRNSRNRPRRAPGPDGRVHDGAQ